MKKKGFTLIELVVTIGIMMIILPIGLKAYKLSKEVANNLKMKEAILDIYDMLSFSKYYCKTNNTTGCVLVSENEICFWDFNNRSFQRKLVLPAGLKFRRTISLNCDYNGTLSAGSIYLQNEKDKLSRISIAVGIDNISIYE